jgi:hypothetical protein
MADGDAPDLMLQSQRPYAVSRAPWISPCRYAPD